MARKASASARDPAEFARMSDIAEQAGVSLMTVWRTMREPAKVAPATLARVKAITEKVGYVPNLVAGALAGQRSAFVVVIIPNLKAEIYSECVAGIEQVCEAAGLRMLLGSNGYSLESELKLLESLVAYRPAGVILTGHTHLPGTLQLIARYNLPVVETFNLSENPIGVCVGYSNFQAMHDITSMLLKDGRRDIVHLCTSYTTNDRNADRRAGYAAAMRDHGLGSDAIRYLPTEFTYKGAGQALSDYLDTHPKPDAIVCGGDVLAIGALLRCQQRGIHVPDDVAIAGFDDLELASIISPAITTVRIPRRSMGEVAAEHLVRQIQGKAPRRKIVDLGYEIVRRATT